MLLAICTCINLQFICCCLIITPILSLLRLSLLLSQYSTQSAVNCHLLLQRMHYYRMSPRLSKTSLTTYSEDGTRDDDDEDSNYDTFHEGMGIVTTDLYSTSSTGLEGIDETGLAVAHAYTEDEVNTLFSSLILLRRMYGKVLIEQGNFTKAYSIYWYDIWEACTERYSSQHPETWNAG